MNMMNRIQISTETPSFGEEYWRLMAEDHRYNHSVTTVLLQEANAKVEKAQFLLAEQEKKIRELENLALTDPVTGLMNRRGFEKFFAQELARVRRYNSLGSVLILFDLNKFKEINDTYGHQAGDACLKKVAEYVLANIRNLEGAARIGGDEFAILLTHTTVKKALNHIEEIRNVLSNMQIEWQGETLHFGASMGMQEVSADSSYEGAYEAADQDLYKHKRQAKRKAACA